MAGDNYFDADAYLRAQNDDFSNLVLGANKNGLSPLPDSPASAPTSGPSTLDTFARLRAEQAQRDQTNAHSLSGALIPFAKRAATIAADVSPVYGSEKFAPRETVPNAPGSMGPPLAAKTQPDQLALKPMAADYPEVKAAPTLAEQARKALGVSGGVSMSPGGGGLLADWRNAQRDQVDTMGHGADLQIESGYNKADATRQMADLRAAQAAQMQRDAEQQAAVEADANARHEAFLAQSQKMADAITANQIDPSRFLHNADAKTQFVIGLGAALGGVSASANGGPNHFLDRLDGIMDRDFKGQMANADNARSALSARNTVFGQVMAQTQDRRLGDMQARDLMYTAMKTKLLSDADRIGIPEIITQAKIAANEIENKQRQLQTSIAQQSYQSAVAAAQAAAAHQRAEEERKWQHDVERIKLDQEQQKIDKTAAPGEKDKGERAVVLDGKDVTAVNKTAAEKWNEYNHGRAVFAQSLEKLKAAREHGDVGAYNAARATLIEEYPKLLGYTRAPTAGQIEHTVGPEVIPEYNHWYNSGAGYSIVQGRGAEKIKAIDDTLAVSDKAMRENTFGADAPIAKGALAPSAIPDKKGTK